MPINWNLANPAEVGGSVFRGFREGMEMGKAAREMEDRRALRGALATLATNPEDRGALSTVFMSHPEVGAKLMDRADDMAFRRDVGEWVAPDGQANALGGRGGALSGFGPQRNAFAGVPALEREASFTNAFAPIADGSYPSPLSPSAPAAKPEARADEPDLSILGEPTTSADRAFLRAVRRDPIKALKIKSALRDNFVDSLKAEGEIYTLGIAELGRATDEASWDAAVALVDGRARAVGVDIFQAVPSSYPGPDGVADLMRRAQPVKDQIDVLLREANQDADHARADRNTDSMIAAREAGVAERERHNRAGEGNTRRGQDLTDARSRRGQDMRGGRERIVAVKTPAEALKLPKGTKFRGPDGKVRIVP